MSEIQVHPEIRFTKATGRCPNPERWHSTDDQSTELEVIGLVAAFVVALQPDYVIETGTYVGMATRPIGQALQANGQGRLDAIEINTECARIARLNTDDLDNVTIHEMSSMDFTPTDTIGFAWFDSLVNLRIPEFRLYREWMQAGTICGFHDTAPHHGTWSQALNDIPGTRAIHLPTPRGVTFLEIL